MAYEASLDSLDLQFTEQLVPTPLHIAPPTKDGHQTPEECIAPQQRREQQRFLPTELIFAIVKEFAECDVPFVRSTSQVDHGPKRKEGGEKTVSSASHFSKQPLTMCTGEN